MYLSSREKKSSASAEGDFFFKPKLIKPWKSSQKSSFFFSKIFTNFLVPKIMIPKKNLAQFFVAPTRLVPGEFSKPGHMVWWRAGYYSKSVTAKKMESGERFLAKSWERDRYPLWIIYFFCAWVARNEILGKIGDFVENPQYIHDFKKTYAVLLLM